MMWTNGEQGTHGDRDSCLRGGRSVWWLEKDMESYSSRRFSCFCHIYHALWQEVALQMCFHPNMCEAVVQISPTIIT